VISRLRKAMSNPNEGKTGMLAAGTFVTGEVLTFRTSRCTRAL